MVSFKKNYDDLSKGKLARAIALIRKDPSIYVGSATDHELRIIYQSTFNDDGIVAPPFFYVDVFPNSDIGRNLRKLGFVRLIEVGPYRTDYLALTDAGIEIRNALMLRTGEAEVEPARSNSTVPVLPVGRPLSPLQVMIKSLRTSWAGRPRFDRFTIRSLRYRWKLWMMETHPETSIIDWSKIPVTHWTDEDTREQREAWHRSELLAFWLCPDGISAGIVAHDAFLEKCKPNEISKHTPDRMEVLSEITGVKLLATPVAIVKPDDTKAPKGKSHIDDAEALMRTLNTPFKTYHNNTNKKLPTKELNPNKSTKIEKLDLTKGKIKESKHSSDYVQVSVECPKCGKLAGAMKKPAHPDSRRFICGQCRNTWFYSEVFSEKKQNEYNTSEYYLESYDPYSKLDRYEVSSKTALYHAAVPKKTPCGHSNGAVISKKSSRAVCHTCGASWIPASRNVLEVASDMPYSFSKSKYY